MGNQMSGASLGFENELWRAADALRSDMDAAEYKHVRTRPHLPPAAAFNPANAIEPAVLDGPSPRFKCSSTLVRNLRSK
jgi:hypothetical protein